MFLFLKNQNLSCNQVKNIINRIILILQKHYFENILIILCIVQTNIMQYSTDLKQLLFMCNNYKKGTDNHIE